MKRLLSLLVVSIMLVTMMNIPMVSADSSVTPVFTMDISEYTDDNQVVKNGVSKSADGINVIKYVNGDTTNPKPGPMLKEEWTANSGTIKYLSFTDAKEADTAKIDAWLGGIELTKEATQALLGANGEFTVEIWAKTYTAKPYSNGVDYGSWGRIFKFGSHTPENYANETAIFADGGSSIHARPVFAQKNSSSTTRGEKTASDTENKWSYFAMSRKWTPDAEGTSGTYTWNIRINDTIVDGGSTKAIEMQDISNMFFTIGGNGGPTIHNVFHGGIAEFNVYNKMLTTEELTANYNAKKAIYDGALADIADTMNCTNEETGAEISTSSGSYELTFDNYVDAETLENGITLKNSEGSVVATAKSLKETTASKTVVITYPALNEGEYTLTVNSNLKSVNGIASGLKTITFTAKKTKDYIFDEPFNYSNTTEGVLDKTNLNSQITLDMNNKAVSYKAETSETTGDKWITGWNPNTTDKDVDIKVSFGSKHIKESFAVDFALKITGITAVGDNPRIRFLNTSSNVNSNIIDAYLAKNDKPFSSLNLKGLATQTDSASKISTETDSDGFVTARFTFSRTPDGNFDVAVRNLNDSAADGISLIEATSTLTQVNGLYFKRYEKANSVASWSISKLSAYKVADYKVLSHGFSADRTTYDIIMSDNLNENYASGITLAIGEDAVNATVSANKISIPAANLANGTQTISLEGILSANDVYCYDSVSYTKDGITFKNADDKIINGFNKNTGIVKAVITASEDTYEAFMVVYDGDGNIKKIEPGTEISLDDLSIENDWIIKCIVLDSLTSLEPLFTTSEITLDYCL